MNKKMKQALILSLALNASLGFYSYPFMKAQLTAYSIEQAETFLSWVKQPRETKEQPDLTMIPKVTLEELEANYPAGKSDIIAQILEGN